MTKNEWDGGGEREHTEFETKAPFRFITQFTSPKRKIRPYKLRHLINEFLDSIRCVALSRPRLRHRSGCCWCCFVFTSSLAPLPYVSELRSLRSSLLASSLFFLSSFFLTTWNFVSFFRTFASLILSKDHWFFDRFYVLLVFFVPCFSMWNETSDGDEWIGWLVTWMRRASRQIPMNVFLKQFFSLSLSFFFVILFHCLTDFIDRIVTACQNVYTNGAHSPHRHMRWVNSLHNSHSWAAFAYFVRSDQITAHIAQVAQLNSILIARNKRV